MNRAYDLLKTQIAIFISDWVSENPEEFKRLSGGMKLHEMSKIHLVGLYDNITKGTEENQEIENGLFEDE